MSSHPFSYTVVTHEVPSAGRRYAIEADAAARARLAGALGIPDLPALSADLEVRPSGGHSYSVRGMLRAAVVQVDVVTLEPIGQELTEPLDVTLSPAETAMPDGRFVEAQEPAGSDVYQNGRIDLGMLVAEHLALGLDPYPRAPGSEFAGYVEDDPASDPSPFAVLEGLRKGGE